jgi:hypothetical protein
MIGFINQILRSSNKKAASKHSDKVKTEETVVKEVKKLVEDHDQDDDIDALFYHYFAVDVDEEEPEESFIFI